MVKGGSRDNRYILSCFTSFRHISSYLCIKRAVRYLVQRWGCLNVIRYFQQCLSYGRLTAFSAEIGCFKHVLCKSYSLRL